MNFTNVFVSGFGENINYLVLLQIFVNKKVVDGKERRFLQKKSFA